MQRITMPSVQTRSHMRWIVRRDMQFRIRVKSPPGHVKIPVAACSNGVRWGTARKYRILCRRSTSRMRTDEPARVCSACEVQKIRRHPCRHEVELQKDIVKRLPTGRCPFGVDKP